MGFSRPNLVAQQSEVAASKPPLRYSHSRNGNHAQSTPLANLAERGQPSVLCHRNQLDSSDLRDVQIRGSSPFATAISGFYDVGHIHLSHADESKSIAAQHGIGHRENTV
jgi:hypothetical protein